MWLGSASATQLSTFDRLNIQLAARRLETNRVKFNFCFGDLESEMCVWSVARDVLHVVLVAGGRGSCGWPSNCKTFGAIDG